MRRIFHRRMIALATMIALVSACAPPHFNQAGDGFGQGKGSGSQSSSSFLTRIQKFFRPTGGGTAAATSTNYKLKGVSIASTGNHPAASASFKSKDAETGIVRGN
jgi:hypothetical protein